MLQVFGVILEEESLGFPVTQGSPSDEVNLCVYDDNTLHFDQVFVIR